MAHNSDYTKIWNPYGDSEGLGLEEVAQAVGVSVLDLATVCTSNNINEWSKYKPVNYPSNPGTLTETERYNSNYGFTFTHTKITPGTTQGLIDFINYIFEHTDAWKDDYAARQTYYRLLDFSAVNASGEENGYDSGKVAPYVPCQDVTLWKYAGTVSIQKRASSAYDLDFPDFKAVTGNTYPNRCEDDWKDDWYYALIVLGGNGIYFFHSGLTYRDYEDGDAASVVITLSGLPQSLTSPLKAIWVLTKAPDATTVYGYEAVYIPKSKLQIIKMATTYVPVSVASRHDGTTAFQQNAGYVFDITIGTGFTASFTWDSASYNLTGAKVQALVRFFLRGISAESLNDYDSDYHDSHLLGEAAFGASSPLAQPSFYSSAQAIANEDLSEEYAAVIGQIEEAGETLETMMLYAQVYFLSGDASDTHHRKASITESGYSEVYIGVVEQEQS